MNASRPARLVGAVVLATVSAAAYACGDSKNDAADTPPGTVADAATSGDVSTTDRDATTSDGAVGSDSTTPDGSADSAPARAWPNPVIAWTAIGEQDPAHPQYQTTDVFVSRWSGSSWQELGNVSSSQKGSGLAGLALDPSGNPVVLWNEYEPTLSSVYGKMFLKRWTGTAWEELVGSASGEGLSSAKYDASLAIDKQGRIVYAYGPNVCVKRYNGSAWEDLGGSSTGTCIAAGGSGLVVAVDAADQPVVAWQNESGNDCNIYLRRWNGSTWEELGGSGSGMGVNGTHAGISDPTLVMGNDGNPVIGWRVSGADTDYQVRRWTGSSWSALAGPDGGVDASNPSCTSGGYLPLIVDSLDRPVVSRNAGNDAPLSIERWNGTTWELLPSPGTTHRAGLVPVENGGIIASWSSPTIALNIQRYDAVANTWADIPGWASDGGFPETNGIFPAIATQYPYP